MDKLDHEPVVTASFPDYGIMAKHLKVLQCIGTTFHTTLYLPFCPGHKHPYVNMFTHNLCIWCHSHSRHHFCIAKIGRAVLPAFLISLVGMLYLVIRTTLQDRILIAQKLTELLILTHCQFGRGNLLLDIAGVQPPRQRLILSLPPQNS